MNRRDFFGVLLVAPIVGLAVLKQTAEGEPAPLIINKDDSYYAELGQRCLAALKKSLAQTMASNTRWYIPPGHEHQFKRIIVGRSV